MATASKTKAAPAGASTRGIKVVSRPASFWRAGIQFTDQPRVIALSDLTAEQYEAITNEPKLVVTEVDLAAEGAAK